MISPSPALPRSKAFFQCWSHHHQSQKYGHVLSTRHYMLSCGQMSAFTSGIKQFIFRQYLLCPSVVWLWVYFIIYSLISQRISKCTQKNNWISSLKKIAREYLVSGRSYSLVDTVSFILQKIAFDTLFYIVSQRLDK